MLRSQVSDMRVMSFGYESDWFGSSQMRTSLFSIGRLLLDCLLRERQVRLFS